MHVRNPFYDDDLVYGHSGDYDEHYGHIPYVEPRRAVRRRSSQSSHRARRIENLDPVFYSFEEDGIPRKRRGSTGDPMTRRRRRPFHTIRRQRPASASIDEPLDLHPHTGSHYYYPCHYSDDGIDVREHAFLCNVVVLLILILSFH